MESRHDSARGGCWVPQKDELIGASDDPAHSRCACFWFRAASSSMNERYSAKASALEKALLLSTTISGEISCEKTVQNTPPYRSMTPSSITACPGVNIVSSRIIFQKPCTVALGVCIDSLSEFTRPRLWMVLSSDISIVRVYCTFISSNHWELCPKCR